MWGHSHWLISTCMQLTLQNIVLVVHMQTNLICTPNQRQSYMCTSVMVYTRRSSAVFHFARSVQTAVDVSVQLQIGNWLLPRTLHEHSYIKYAEIGPGCMVAACSVKIVTVTAIRV